MNFTAREANIMSTHNHTISDVLVDAMTDIKTASSKGLFNTVVYKLRPDDVDNLRKLGYSTTHMFSPSYKSENYPCYISWKEA